MKQINPLSIHSASLYRMSELHFQASKDKLALEMMRSRIETLGQGHVGSRPFQRSWLSQKAAGLGKFAPFRGQTFLNRLK